MKQKAKYKGHPIQNNVVYLRMNEYDNYVDNLVGDGNSRILITILVQKLSFN